jgi:hypothetical protein
LKANLIAMPCVLRLKKAVHKNQMKIMYTHGIHLKIMNVVVIAIKRKVIFKYLAQYQNYNRLYLLLNKTNVIVTDKCKVVKLQPNYLYAGKCRSTAILPRETCKGTCNSHESSYLKIDGVIYGDKVCKCCSADKTYIEKVQVDCDGKKKMVDYVRIESCKCELCGVTDNHINPK